jgi:ATP-dependent RNA helicase RhlE
MLLFLLASGNHMQKNYQARSKFGRNNNSRNQAYGGGRKFSHFGSGPRRNSSKPKVFREEIIEIDRFIKKSSITAPEVAIEVKNTFADFNLSKEIVSNLKKKNYIIPTPIQDQSINHIMQGRDLIGLANTGTGKTAAFLLPLINKVFKDKTQKVLIIAPTRELAVQIEEEFRHFAHGTGLKCAICVGGLSIYTQLNNLRNNPNFVIGTPGRLKDLSDRRAVNFASFNNVVIDEVDRMLDMGFINEIRGFMDRLPKTRQTLFFSATLPDKIKDLAKSFLNNPMIVEAKTGETPCNVDQDIIKVTDRNHKFNQLHALLSQPELNKVLIFSRTKSDVIKLTYNLANKGFKVESIHGSKRQGQRQKALSQFKSNTVNILVATDIAARGLDIKDISHVINYTVPQTYDDYIHRIGRTGRAGSIGKAITFVEVRQSY